ncbi:MAG: hypothetical protein ALECFALPRED_001412 [Alectoria fallacina]|uniref:DNA replication factor Cdt1 C-terminal domain-containing protein n=1 Tax=Alectoria fallacina TaxID=1903189 RepID=A0A8H3F8D7_9LECA|nr:MAG: hypothetical protein ALECFALPRED_001412 [Alectoria fallacina]
MPPATKRRKVSVTVTRSLTAPAAQRGIQAFGKISKSQVQDPGKGVLGKNSPATHSKVAPSGDNSKKRKLGSIYCPTDKKEGEQVPTIDDGSYRPVERSADPTTSTSSQTKILRKTPLESSHVETPTRGTRSYLESLALASSSPSSCSSRTPVHKTPPSSPSSAKSKSPQHNESHQLPDSLQDLVNLYSSFLTALSLHYAHNGSMTPADLRNLGPGIERAWRKRRVTPDDVRRILAIGRPEGADGYQRAGALYLSDYGHGKICVEVANHSDLPTTTRRPINEEVLNTVFVRELEQRWMCYKTNSSADPSPSKFLASLALLPITPCSSLSKVAPLLSKGQRRLEDLKDGAIKAQQRPLSITSANSTTLSHLQGKKTAARSTDLFSRLKAKQLHQSTIPLPPSAEILARKSALQRLHEITPVLESLANFSKKHVNDDVAAVGIRPMASIVSFTLPTLVQHLQMSLRNPISKKEVVESLRLLADAAPGWVEVKEVGRMIGVTLKVAGSKDEIGRKIESLLENL